MFPVFEQARSAQFAVSVLMIYPFSAMLKKLSMTSSAYYLRLDNAFKYAFLVYSAGFIPLLVIFSRYSLIDSSASCV